MTAANHALLQACTLAIGLLSSSPALAAADADLGRLFSTPQHRAQLDDLRRRNVPITRPQPAQADTNIALQGIVRRSSGRSTIWINGKARQDTLPVQSISSSSARISLEDGRLQELKVGEKLQILPRPISGDDK